jgi:ATP-dependent Clp protease ATP-binding subunit ClpC
MTDKAKDFIVDKGYDEKFGARPLKRAIQKYIEDPLAEEMLSGNFHAGDAIMADVSPDDAEKIIFKKIVKKEGKKKELVGK